MQLVEPTQEAPATPHQVAGPQLGSQAEPGKFTESQQDVWDESEDLVEDVAVPVEVLYSVFSYLTSMELLYTREVCSGWEDIGSTEDAWESRKDRLWSKKYVADTIKALEVPSIQKFWFSFHDSKRAVFHGLHELCGPRIDLPPGVWCMRFKAQAGGFWMNMDPWWKGGAPIRIKLNADGTMESACDSPTLWGKEGNPAGYYTVSEQNGRSTVQENGRPTMEFFRHPVHWGLYMHSIWCVWTAFPMEPLGKDLLMEDYWLSVRPENPMYAQNFEAQKKKMLDGL